MNRIPVHEDVTVAVIFAGGQVRPRSFSLHGHTLTVEQIHRQWTGRHRQQPLLYFAITAGGSPYTLCFFSHDLTWMVKEM